MQSERENLYTPLQAVDYDIAGNVFRAYYDADRKLVFVLDFVVNEVKPNVLLVINPVGNRKWDDILTNDYAVNLETVRPKKDNKYQKLDIEYAGLAEYDELIRAYEADDDVADAIDGLEQFRNGAAYRAALERLGNAATVAERARETIEKTSETVAELRERIKVLRNKLAAQRKDVGREPTKQSAAKILKTEAQIDNLNEKLKRAKKRLDNAQRRLAAAEDDAAVARDILELLEDVEDVEDYDDTLLPTAPAVTDVAVMSEAKPPLKKDPGFTEVVKYEDLTNEPRANEMADDDDVKPLFDKNPNILDDEIAFKPIDFGTSDIAEPVLSDGDLYPEKKPENAPLQFVPPVQPSVSVPVAQPQPSGVQDVPAADNVPVLDSLTPVVLPSERIDAELLSTVDIPALPQDVNEPVSGVGAYESVRPVEPLVQQPANYGADVQQNWGAQEPQQRPVSPVAPVAAAAPVDVVVQRKPAVLYYVMLILLIVLSIFTLWIYQKSANNNLPELGTQSGVEAVQEVTEPVQVVQKEPVEVAEPEVKEPVVPAQEEVATDVEESAVIVDVEVVPEPQVEVVQEESPFVSDEVAEVEKKPSIAEILAKKPAYNVSQNEKMFVAAPEYDTEVVGVVEEYVTINSGEDVGVVSDAETVDDAPIEESNAYVVDVEDSETVYVPDEYNTYSEPTIVRQTVADTVEATEYVPQEVASELLIDDDNQNVESGVVETCLGGGVPDENGCCTGEELVNNGGELVCCVVGTNECFPPML